MSSEDKTVLQCVPACSLLDTHEFLYEKFLGHNRKKEEYNCPKLSDLTRGRRVSAPSFTYGG
jgi:hypothetical protein